MGYYFLGIDYSATFSFFLMSKFVLVIRVMVTLLQVISQSTGNHLDTLQED